MPWSYLKMPYLKRFGWHGVSEETSRTIMRTGPLGSLNASDGMQTPRAQAEYERFYATFGGKPVHQTLAFHWARLIEMLQAAELVERLANDERLTSPDVRTVPSGTPREGVGTVEAPRGLLTHHYITDENGIVEKANLIVGTTYQYPAIQLSVATAARGLVRPGVELTEPVMNGIEMAFRAYDPCFGCATHALPGSSPLEVRTFASRRRASRRPAPQRRRLARAHRGRCAMSDKRRPQDSIVFLCDCGPIIRDLMDLDALQTDVAAHARRRHASSATSRSARPRARPSSPRRCARTPTCCPVVAACTPREHAQDFAEACEPSRPQPLHAEPRQHPRAGRVGHPRPRRGHREGVRHDRRRGRTRRRAGAARRPRARR